MRSFRSFNLASPVAMRSFTSFTFASKIHCGHSPLISKIEWPHSLLETQMRQLRRRCNYKRNSCYCSKPYPYESRASCGGHPWNVNCLKSQTISNFLSVSTKSQSNPQPSMPSSQFRRVLHSSIIRILTVQSP